MQNALEKVIRSLFCNLCSQVVTNKPMSRRVLDKNHFVKVFKLRKIYFCNFREIYVRKENIKNHEITRDYSEDVEIHVGYCDRLLIFFAMYVKF